MGRPMPVTYISVATQTSPLDLRDAVATSATVCHRGVVEEGMNLEWVGVYELKTVWL